MEFLVGYVVYSCVPAETRWSVIKSQKEWGMPKLLYNGIWWVTGMSYTISAYNKIGKTSIWLDGEAVRAYLEFAYARDNWLTRLMLNLPDFGLHLLTYYVLVIELFALPLSLFSKSRPILWVGLLMLHIGIASTSILTMLSVTLLIYHILLFDRAWLKFLPELKWPVGLLSRSQTKSA